MSKPSDKPAVNTAKKHWCFLAFVGPAGWYDQNSRKTEVTAVAGSNAEWKFHKRVGRVSATTLVVRFRFEKFVLTKDAVAPTEGDVTVTLTDVGTGEQPPPVTVVYDGDDPDNP